MEAIVLVIGALALAHSHPATFSGSLSEVYADASEQVLLNHTLAANNAAGLGGSLGYLWVTGDACVAELTIRVYIDGEISASLAYEPAKAVGIGILNTSHGDPTPWGSKWIGSLGRNSYYNMLRAPFQKSVLVTFQNTHGGSCFFFGTARGSEGLVLDGILPGITLPPTARLHLQVHAPTTYDPLAYMPLANIPAGSNGALIATMLWWNSSSPNTIEGCVRAFTPANATWPGLLISTGWEDYYASAWGMIAGPFTSDISGVLYWTSPSNLETSVYRFHTMDPIFYSDGLRVVLRNGETRDARGQKCTVESGGAPVGQPGQTTLGSYAWWYSW